ncbi:hypothetical protein TrRE_jg4014 [Triparma retinervis]|uniref:Bromo domain-containing protein n=1 Tax=Triparma retinervis TaxID=2557542 RepID=A0A9W7AKI8_9STRA|nr:hypothetical protein TrRE_jg4014 [Triparma retinervis]
MATEQASFDKFTKLVEQIIARPDSDAFRDPVPWEELGLIDYPQIVKQPMDLSTVLTNLQTNKYATIHAAIDDIRLIWANCQSPQALTKNASEDEVEINVDFIVPRVFHELNNYVGNLVNGGFKVGTKFVADKKK